MYRHNTGKTMASPDDGRESDEEKELESMQKTFLERKKAVFQETREKDEELQKSRREEMAVQERPQKVKAERREVEEIENIELKESGKKTESLQAELSCVKENVAVCEREHGRAGALNKMKEQLKKVKDAMPSIARYSKTQRREKEDILKRITSLERDILDKEKLQMEQILEKDKVQGELASLEAELRSVKEKVALFEREHGGAGDVHKMKEELEAMRQPNVEQSASLIEAKDATRRITSYPKTQQKEKEDALKRVASLEQLQIEVARLKDESLEKDKLQREVTSLEAELISMREKVAVCEREHGGAGGVNEMKEELETLRQQNVEQNASLRKVKDAMQSVTSYSKTQQKEKEQALGLVASLKQDMLEKENLRREVGSLKDEILALRLISEETQQRQLNEIQSSSSVKEQQQSTGKVNELMLYVL